MELINKIYHKCSGLRIVRMAGNIYRNGFFLSNYKAYLRLKKLQNQHYVHDKVRVVFLCQYVQAWNKMESVCERMIADDRFEVILFAVPYQIQEPDEEVYRYFKKLYGDKVIDAYERQEWKSLEALEPDYVFYQRPYDSYLPKQYQSGRVSAYSKICHIVYGYLLTETAKNICMNKLFFRNVYYYFAENEICWKENVDRFKKSHRQGYRKTVNIGYPCMEHFMKKRTEAAAYPGQFRILWTPRWSEDKEVGGSNFLNFKDEVIKLPQMREDLFVVFRPHPMTFSHFVSINKMTQEQADRYIQVYEEHPRLEYDKSADFASVFWNTDVMLTDVSSVIVEYFLTGKPIIYCDTGATPNSFFQEILKVCYVVKSWEEAQEYLMKLADGKDPLKEKRLRKIESLMGNDFEHISEKFIEEIWEDYSSTMKEGD